MTPKAGTKLDATLDAAEATVERARGVLRRYWAEQGTETGTGEGLDAHTPISRGYYCPDCGDYACVHQPEAYQAHKDGTLASPFENATRPPIFCDNCDAPGATSYHALAIDNAGTYTLDEGIENALCPGCKARIEALGVYKLTSRRPISQDKDNAQARYQNHVTRSHADQMPEWDCPECHDFRQDAVSELMHLAHLREEAKRTPKACPVCHDPNGHAPIAYLDSADGIPFCPPCAQAVATHEDCDLDAYVSQGLIRRIYNVLELGLDNRTCYECSRPIA